MKRPRVVLLGPDAARLAEELGHDGRFLVPWQSHDTDLAVETVLRCKPDILVLVSERRSATRLEAVARAAPYATIVLVSHAAALKEAVACMEAGASGYLPLPEQPGVLPDYLHRVHSQVRARKQEWQEQGTPLLHPRRPRLIAVFSPKGGVGKTTVATNLAVSLQQLTEQPTLLLDMDVAAGDAAVMLDVKPEHSLLDFARALAADDDVALAPYLCRHSSGVRLLAAPASPDRAELIRPSHIKKAVELARQEADYLVADTAPAFTDQVLAILDSADTILMLLTPDVAALKNVRTALGVMENLHYPAEKVQVVLNRSATALGLSTGEVEDVLGRPVIATIPNDPHVVTGATNQGRPFVLEQSGAPVSRSLLALAARLVGEAGSETVVADRSGVWQRLFRRVVGRRG